MSSVLQQLVEMRGMEGETVDVNWLDNACSLLIRETCFS